MRGNDFIMEKDPKRMYFESKEDLILLLNLLIELTVKHFKRYDVYYHELFELAVSRLKMISVVGEDEITAENFKDKLELAISSKEYEAKHRLMRISYYEYKSLEDKIENVEGALLNLLGDRTSKGGVSYWRFRHEYKKMKGTNTKRLPELEEFSEDFNQILNEMYHIRNYSHHMTDAKFIEWIDYRKKQLELWGYKLFQYWPKECIEIDRYEYLDIEWIWQLVLTHIDFRRGVKVVLQQMKKDYSVLYGKPIQIRLKYRDTSSCEHFEISYNGIERHLGKRK